MSGKPELTHAEKRVLAFHGWRETGSHRMLLTALGMETGEFDAAETRLLAIGFIGPGEGVSRQ